MRASVVIPFYNAEATLSRAIDSTLSQHGVTLQILLIDNNSTDQSRDIAQSYADKYENITLHIESTQGANHARNLGLDLADNEWIQYLDADDELLPNKIYHQLSIDNLEKVDIILSPFREYTVTGKVIDYEIDSCNDIPLSIIRGKYGITTSILWRKSAIESVNGWNTNQSSHQEQELLFRLSIQNKRFVYFDKSESIIHEQENSISHSANFPITGVKLLKKIEDYFIKTNTLTQQRKIAIQNQYYNKILWAYKINPSETKPYLNLIDQKYNAIDRPWYHKVLTRIIGLKNTFSLLHWIASSKN